MDSVASLPSIKEMIDLEIRRLAHSHCAFVKWLAVASHHHHMRLQKEGAEQKHETVLSRPPTRERRRRSAERRRLPPQLRRSNPLLDWVGIKRRHFNWPWGVDPQGFKRSLLL
jgi:hypothetical protein